MLSCQNKALAPPVLYRSFNTAKLGSALRILLRNRSKPVVMWPPGLTELQQEWKMSHGSVAMIMRHDDVYLRHVKNGSMHDELLGTYNSGDNAVYLHGYRYFMVTADY